MTKYVLDNAFNYDYIKLAVTVIKMQRSIWTAEVSTQFLFGPGDEIEVASVLK